MAKLVTNLPWTAQIDGADLLVLNVEATCFGGGFDKGDNGKTASGVMNDGSDPTLLGVALPILSVKSTKNSPLCFGTTRFPWRTTVVVVWRASNPAFTVSTILIDNGPSTATYPNRAIDLNPTVAAKFAPDKTPEQLANGWSATGFCYRVVDGAKFVPPGRIVADASPGAGSQSS